MKTVVFIAPLLFASGRGLQIDFYFDLRLFSELVGEIYSN